MDAGRPGEALAVGVVARHDMSKLKTGGVTLIAVALNVGWLWGVASYGIAGNALGAIAAFVVPPVGVLHTIGVI
jgi:hypothetical protein